jgi:hypothetical protein
VHYPIFSSTRNALFKTTLSGSRVALCLSLLALSGAALSASPASGTHPGSSAISSVESTPGHVKLDDAVAVRNALAGQSAGTSDMPPSLRERIRNFAHEHFGKNEASGSAATGDGRDRTFAFAIPATHGLLYRSSTHLLTVNASLTGEEHPDSIQLHKTITGPRGHQLVIAPDAKAKGYVQTIDLIELATGGKQTSARGHLKLSPEAFAKADGNFAIVLVCNLRPPYLTDRHEHNDPTDEEPTDITMRTSTLHASIEAVWLIDQQDGTVLAKGLHLGK